uniref:NB-ARC domain-containing protein n=1 Tax=Opuntia streptacantha TaxID=393608 RepID=A0A7C9DCW6_OPUST
MPDCSLYRSTPMGLSVITQMFKNLCNGRRTLIVLDDVCNFVKPLNHWEEFETVLRDCSCAMFGVIITTRNPKVTTTVASLSSFPIVSRYLQLMSDEDCASIVQQKAYSGAINRFKRSRCGKSILQTEMIQMVQKFCKGLPLVADIIGHRLSLEPEAAISSALLFRARVQTANFSSF